MCALDFGFGQRAVGGAHSTNNPGLIPASAVYVYTCTRSWGTRTQARMASYWYTRTGTRVESGQTDESPRMCVFICIYICVCVCVYIVCIHTYMYIYIYLTVKSIWFACLYVDDGVLSIFPNYLFRVYRCHCWIRVDSRI